METLYELELETFKIKLAVAEPVLTPCHSAEDAYQILRPIYADLDVDQEHFVILLLNNKNRVRGFKCISSGSLTSALVHPREVFKPVMLYGAAGVVLAHNHPAGDPAPSPEDIDLTRRLKECADLLGIRVLDHVIIGKDSHFSFEEKGMLGGSCVQRAQADSDKYEGIRMYLWRRDIKRNAIAAALNQRYGYLCNTLRGFRKVDAELDAIAKHLKITRDHLNLLIKGKAPRTEPL